MQEAQIPPDGDSAGGIVLVGQRDSLDSHIYTIPSGKLRGPQQNLGCWLV